MYKIVCLNLGAHDLAIIHFWVYTEHTFDILPLYFHFLLNPIKLKRGPCDLNKILLCVLALVLYVRLPIETC